MAALAIDHMLPTTLLCKPLYGTKEYESGSWIASTMLRSMVGYTVHSKGPFVRKLNVAISYTVHAPEITSGCGPHEYTTFEVDFTNLPCPS